MYKGFDSIDEAFAWMQEQEAKANADVHPAQKRIDRGTYALRPAPEVPCLIFGYILTEEEIREGEVFAGADEGELAFTMDILASSYQRGYRYGRWYSVVVPEGEIGDAHIANLWPLTKEVFDAAKEQGWQLTQDQYVSALWHIVDMSKTEDI